MARRTTSLLIAFACALGLSTQGAAAAPGDATPAASKPSLTVSPAKPTTMRGKAVKFTVKGAPGKVKVYQGSKKVKTLKLRSGRATFSTSKKLARGSHKFRFVHSPSGKSRTVKLVVRAKSTLTVSATPTSFPREERPGRLNLKITSEGKAVGGVFTVSQGALPIAKVKAKAGKAVVTLPEGLAKGKHTFTVKFAPTSKYVKAPAAKKVTVTVTSLAAFAGDGMFIVGVDVKPGLYLSRANTGLCYWARHSDFAGSVIENDIGYGNRYVEILPGDKVVETSRCADFIPAPSAKNPTTTIPGDGMYRIGYDIAPGVYRTNGVGKLCYWSRLSNATGEDSIIDNDAGYGSRIAEISPTDAFFESSGCGTWTRIG